MLNDPLFGARTLDERSVRALTAVVARKELFRYHAGGGESETDRFERELASAVGAEDACAVSSGTAGLRAAMAAAGLGVGDSVLVSAFTFVASASAAISLGCHPVPLDLGRALDVDLDDLVKKIGGVRAVVPVYAPGYASNVDAVVELAKAEGVTVIEDACQALGVTTQGRAAGTLGDLGVYSFQQGKQLCSGEGGAIVSGRRDLLASARRFGDHGAERSADGRPDWEAAHAGFGENHRMTELQSSVLRVQLEDLDGMVHRQRTLRTAIIDSLPSYARPISSTDPLGDSGSFLAFLCPSAASAAELVQLAARHDICMRWMWRNAYFELPPFKRSDFASDGDLTPRAVDWAPRLLALPVPPLSPEESTLFMPQVMRFFEESGHLWA